MTPRERLLKALAEMPDEAFQWAALAIRERIWPDGIGGFTSASRKGIVEARKAADEYLKEQP